MRRIWLGIDTGGTFTDLTAVDQEGAVVATCKVPTTPDDRSLGMIDAIDALARDHGVKPGEIAAILHGTTVGTNALLERRLARTALIVTAGFRDLLAIARQDRPSLYDPFDRRADPVIPRRLTFEVHERTTWDGAVEAALMRDEVSALGERLRRARVESVAICLLHSYLNDSNERALEDILRQCLPAVPVTRSSALLPRLGEFERASTAAVNAALAPVVERYLTRLQGRLKDVGIMAPVYIMRSDGGLAGLGRISGHAVQTVLSGPAGGVVATLRVGQESTSRHLMSVDMGGTSFDIALEPDRKIELSSESEIDGIPISTRSIRIHTLGAGGGSIAWVDDGGGLRIGPRSAGARPGPACYGLGGVEPTVTDANLVLGRLSESLLDGALLLHRDLASRAIERMVASPLGLTVEEAALGIIRVVNAEMSRGMRAMSIARGYHPHDVTLVAFGGAGPLHAAELATALDIPEVIVPPAPGATSARGVIFAGLRAEASGPVLRPMSGLRPSALRATVDELIGRATSELSMDVDDSQPIRTVISARLSYEGQGHDLEVPFDGWPEVDLSAAAEAFELAHERHYGYRRNDPIWLTSIHASAAADIGPTEALQPAPLPHTSGGDAPRGHERPVRFGSGWAETRVVRRSDLQVGLTLDGPVILDQLDSTTVVPPGARARADHQGNLRITTARSQ